MVAGPEIANVQEFESTLKSKDSPIDILCHHDQSSNVQHKFKNEVNNVKAFENVGNPFLEQGSELVALHTYDIANKKVPNTVKNIKDIGQQQYSTFVTERLVNRTTKLTDPIKRNKFPHFTTSEP